MTAREANELQQAHYRKGCPVCRSASGVTSQCATGARLYVQYLNARAAEIDIDPNDFPSVRAMKRDE